MRKPSTPAAAAWIAITLLVAPPHAVAERKKRVTRDEFEALAAEVKEQRELLTQLVKVQKENLRAMEKLLGVPETAAAEPAGPSPEPRTPPDPRTPPPEPRTPPPEPREGPAPERAPAEAKGAIVGRVIVRGGNASDAFVYLESSDAGGGAPVRIAQKGKQFVPNVIVVPRGTRVEFPNGDAVFHNVFSVTAGNSFDLGSYKKGESRSVVMKQPGVVTVFCNIHPQMIAFILVVPGKTYVRAGKDGFFRLPDVPAGKHRVGAWMPDAAPVGKNVFVGGEVTTVELGLVAAPRKAHLRKDGTPYGSYNE